MSEGKMPDVIYVFNPDNSPYYEGYDCGDLGGIRFYSESEKDRLLAEACEKQRKACAYALLEIYPPHLKKQGEKSKVMKAILSARYDDKSTVESGDE